MSDWIRQNRILLGLNAAVLLCISIAWLVYGVFGQRLIEAIYGGPWIEFLHKAMMMEGPNILPLEQYFRGAERLLKSATLAGALTISAYTLIAKCPQRIAISALCSVFVVFVVLVPVLAFLYPLEIETRESTVWLHVLAMKAGVNIYDHSQVAFLNQNHGPFDSIFKLGIANLLPFLEPWQVARFAVVALPFGFWLLAWKILRKPISDSFVESAYIGSVGYLFLVISAKEFLFVGRSDATAALLLLPLAYLSVVSAPRSFSMVVLSGMLWGTFGIFVALTNGRMLPVVFALFVFSLWRLGVQHRMPFGWLCGYAAGGAITSGAIFATILHILFDFDLTLYYKHFFGIFSHSSGHRSGPQTSIYGHASALWFLGSLFNPTANLDNLKGGPLLLTLVVYLLARQKGERHLYAWLFLGTFIFAACTLAYYLNYYGGGQWYYIPFLIVLWVFLCANRSGLSSIRLSAIGITTAALLLLNFETALAPSLQRASSFAAAQNFLNLVRELQRENTVLSEDTYFYKTSYGGELIDMGDMISKVRRRGDGYYGEAFNQTVDTHFERTRNAPAVYILTGFSESPELRKLIQERYIQVAAGPNNLTGNGRGETKLFKAKSVKQQSLQRTCFGTAVQRILVERQKFARSPLRNGPCE
jgi:hypothetical protein